MEDNDIIHMLKRFVNMDYSKAKKIVVEVQQVFSKEIDVFTDLDYKLQDKVIEILMAIRED